MRRVLGFAVAIAVTGALVATAFASSGGARSSQAATAGPSSPTEKIAGLSTGAVRTA